MSSPPLPTALVSSFASRAAGAAANSSVIFADAPAVAGLPDRSAPIFNVTLITAILAALFTAMRMTSKGWIIRKITLDDWVTVVAWLFSLGASVAIMIGAKSGLGKMDAAITHSMYSTLKRSTFVLTVLYNPALMATKTAILILYIRMAAAHPILRYCSIATMAIVNLAGAICTLIIIFQCHPIHAAWTVGPGQCIDVVKVYLSSAPINILTDLAILLLPLPILTGLRMEARTKIVLVTTFIVGGFVTIVDVIRIAYLQNALKLEQASTPSSSLSSHVRPVNFNYSISFSLMWSAVEVSVGLMCCCVLVLKPLILRIMPAILRDNSPAPIVTPRLESFHLSDLSKSPQSPVGQLRTNHEASEKPEGLNGNDSKDAPKTGEKEGEGMVDFFQMLESGPADHTTSVHTLQPFVTTAAVSTQPFSTVRSAPGLNRPSDPASGGVARNRSYRATLASARGFRSRRNNSGGGQAPTQMFFDFVNMTSRKPLTELKSREAWGPVLFASTLFFLWGFAYGLLGTLSAEISTMLGFGPGKDLAQHDAYWIAYLIGPSVVGYWTLTRGGFKTTFITGLAMLSAGAMAFWPSAVLASYPGFVISNFMVALGLSVLETAANPFIALAGPGELSEARLNFSQGIQAIGSFLSPLLANKVLFKDVSRKHLFNVQWCYLAVAIFVLFLAIIFFYFPLCEVDDEHLETKALERFANAGIASNSFTFGISTRHLLAGSGVLAMWFYVGAQESLSYYWTPISLQIQPSFDPFWDHMIGRAVFAIGRFIASALCFLGLPGRVVLAVYMIGAFITMLLTMVLPVGHAPLAIMILAMFFQSGIFPTLFAMILRGQGRHTKLVATLTTMTIVGGAVGPSASYGVYNARPNDPRFVLIIPVVLHGVSILYPSMLNGVRGLSCWVDPRWSKTKDGEQGDNTQSGGGERKSGRLDTLTGRRETVIENSSKVGLTSGLGMVGLGVSLNGGNLKEIRSFEEKSEKVGDHG
ncbi:hypothetical protein IAR55_001376 [Kwoniella newhampshirensis]|uniref:Rhodopsin domain-containing protein n=1 Tax=Kwoniella newhampshirensis TaxID=1651941 RepID=A0AAW0Z1Z6_9TREE